MKRRRSVRSAAAFVAFALLTGGECSIGDLGDILLPPGVITVSNIGSQGAIVLISVDDARTHVSLPPGGANGSLKTNVGGKYDLRVIMSPENAAAYRAKLTDLRSLVEKQIAGAADALEKTRLYLDLAGIKAAILALEDAQGAGCSGRIRLDENESVNVTATINWMETGGTGFWDLACGST